MILHRLYYYFSIASDKLGAYHRRYRPHSPMLPPYIIDCIAKAARTASTIILVPGIARSCRYRPGAAPAGRRQYTTPQSSADVTAFRRACAPMKQRDRCTAPLSKRIIAVILDDAVPRFRLRHQAFSRNANSPSPSPISPTRRRYQGMCAPLQSTCPLFTR